jgi:hypothetical protein
MNLKTPTVVITALTVAAIGTAPAVATAAGKCSDASDNCRIALNHNEVLATTSGA